MWTPKAGSTTLDTLRDDQWPGFGFMLLRNGHVVGLFLTQDAALSKCTERSKALPEDIWCVFAR